MSVYGLILNVTDVSWIATEIVKEGFRIYSIEDRKGESGFPIGETASAKNRRVEPKKEEKCRKEAPSSTFEISIARTKKKTENKDTSE